MRILLIEDDKDLARTIKEELETEYIIDRAFTATEGEEMILAKNYDVYLITLALPDKNGVKICQHIRKKGIKSAILILTHDRNVDTKVFALDSGADDYLVKPFTFAELKARIRALLRRQLVITNILNVGNLTFDVGNKSVKRGRTVVNLRRKELALLEYLMRNQGKVVSRDMILDNVWHNCPERFHNIVDVHIKYLRDSIDRKYSKKLIKTVYGLGYKIGG